MMTNKNNTVLYIGSTTDLAVRVFQHQRKAYPNSFTARYNLNKLVYFEYFHFIEEALEREKQLKSRSRKKKEDLINKSNPKWNDLYNSIKDW